MIFMNTINKSITSEVTITDRKFWVKWMLKYSFGELMAIGAAATLGRFLFMDFSKHSPLNTSVITFIILVSAGALEGLIIGFVQWKSLSKVIRHFKLAPWMAVTTISAIAGWLLILPPAVMFISFLSKFSMITNYYSIIYTVVVGMSFGGLIGIPQFFIIKKYCTKSLVWIFANAIGWTFSFLIIYTAMLMFNYTTSLLYNLFLIMMSCMLSGLVQGFITGTSLHFIMSVKEEHQKQFWHTARFNIFWFFIHCFPMHSLDQKSYPGKMNRNVKVHLTKISLLANADHLQRNARPLLL